MVSGKKRQLVICNNSGGSVVKGKQTVLSAWSENFSTEEYGLLLSKDGS